MSCAKIATYLDEQMLIKIGAAIAESHVADDDLPKKSGGDVEKELCGRFLLRYVTESEPELKSYVYGHKARLWVTPTAYSPRDCVSWLALPAPAFRRGHVLVLRPSEIPEAWGPRRVYAGFGIEYLLPHGFPGEALEVRWPLEIR